MCSHLEPPWQDKFLCLDCQREKENGEIERLRVQLVESEAKIIELQEENNWLQAKLAAQRIK